MSSDTILTDEEGTKYSYDNFSTQRWLEGQAIGANAVADLLMERAMDLFKVGKDEAAKDMRALAAEVRTKIVPAMRAKAAEHAERFPILVQDEEA